VRLIRWFALHWLIAAVAVGVAAVLLPSVEIDHGVWGLLWVSAAFGLVNALIGPVLHILALPITMVTFGLFALVVNGALLGLTAWWSDYLEVGGPLETIGSALIIAIFSSILHFILRTSRRRAA
jgi:putative membrane protein